MDNYKSINKALNINSEVVPTPEDLVSKKSQLKKVEGQDIGKDYDYTRGNLYSLIEKDKKQSMVLWKLQEKLQVQGHMKLQGN